jgi:Tfp pilus assembly pilus retraction ATPase PilT
MLISTGPKTVYKLVRIFASIHVPQVLFVLYLDLHLEMEIWGRLRMNFYNKRDALNLLLRTIYMYIALSVYKVYISADSTHHYQSG